MKKEFFALILVSLIIDISTIECVATEDERTDCGYFGIQQPECEGKGCCWKESSKQGVPWCYNPGVAPQCPKFDVQVSGPGFDSAAFETMRGFYEKNINIEGKGGVAAALDHSTPGGDYYYHWARDGALTMKAYMYIHNNNYEEIKTSMDAYIDWVRKIEHKNEHTKIEPKFNLPDGTDFTDPWCRPQTDGPGLRMTTFATYGMILLENGQEEYAKGKIKEGLHSDYEWLRNNWGQETCDLWEEVRSNDFFWGRITARKGLLDAAKFLEKIGESGEASNYRNLANSIKNTLDGHWNGVFLFESQNRQRDSAVISGIIEGYDEDDYLPPADEKIAKTLIEFNKLFCREYKTNRDDSGENIPGVLHGRYEGDTYAGGNPWHLTTANVARTYYRGAKFVAEMSMNNKKISKEQFDAWSEACGLDKNKFSFLGDNELILANAMTKAGDSIMQRLYHHVKDDGFHLHEQIDRNTGKQTAARDLTWSYANVLVALRLREKAVAAINNLRYVQ